MTPPPTLTESEIDRLLYALKTDQTGYRYPQIQARDYLIGCLMADAGLRVSEVVNLTPDQVLINFEPARMLHLLATNTKNNHSRTIPFTQRIQAAISNYCPYLPDIDLARPVIWLFPSNNHDKHITTRTVHRIINTTGKRTLNRPVNPHLLRHTYATRILRASNTSVTQQLLGHKSLSSTQVYVHPNQDDLQKAVQSLDKQPKG